MLMDNLNLQYIDGFAVQLVGFKTWAIDEFAITQCYLIEGEDRAALIDTGMGQGNLRHVIDYLTDKPYIILNTHGHIDHIGGNDEFHDHDIYMNELDDKISHIENNTPEINQWHFEKSFHEPGFYGQKIYDMNRTYSGFIYHNLKEGDFFDLGGRLLRIYETPGHTKGSVVIWDETNHYLFSGDTVVSTPILILSDLGNSASVESLRHSMKKLMKLYDQVELIFPGHYIRPIEKEYMEDLQKLTEMICKGTAERSPIDLSHMTKDETVISRYKKASIIYSDRCVL